MIGIIIQARMGSSRLPGKILMDFEGKTLLEHILKRLARLKNPAKVVVATSDVPLDEQVEIFCEKQGVCCFRGSELNVLKRYYDCATEYYFSDIVRMTGDNPFPDIEELDRLIDFHKEQTLDYSESLTVLPIGIGAEIISYKVLEESMQKASLPKHFEHVNEYILDNLAHYRHGILNVPREKNRPEIRLTVDTKQDYEKACFILHNVKSDYVTTEQAIAMSDVFDKMNNG